MLARRWQLKIEGAASPGLRAFRRAMVAAPGSGQVIVAAIRSGGRWEWLGLPTKRLLGCHAAIAGGTGSGKTSWLFGVLAQIACEHRYSIHLFDAKGETAQLVLELLVPLLLDGDSAHPLLDRLRVLRVFDPKNVPLLNITRPEPGVPKEAQAYGVASAVEQALAEPLGGRMHHVLVRGSALCIELGLPITELQRWLDDPVRFQRAAQRSSDTSVREYARTGFHKENRESVRALSSRLNALLFWPGAREALCAPGAVSFADALAEPGITVVDCGNPPSGAERLARFFGAALLGQIARAILSRPVTPDMLPALLVLEEIQEVLGTEEARQVGRLFATARYKGAAVWTTNQSRSQLVSVAPALVPAMRANAGLVLQFRTSPEDAAAFASMLSEDAQGESLRRERINELTRLPRRHCYLAIRDLGLAAQRVVAPKIDFDRLREGAERVPPELRERIQRGIAAIPRSAFRESADEVVDAGSREHRIPDMPPDDGAFPRLG
jgi:hypothetical protein